MYKVLLSQDITRLSEIISRNLNHSPAERSSPLALIQGSFYISAELHMAILPEKLLIARLRHMAVNEVIKERIRVELEKSKKTICDSAGNQITYAQAAEIIGNIFSSQYIIAIEQMVLEYYSRKTDSRFMPDLFVYCITNKITSPDIIASNVSIMAEDSIKNNSMDTYVIIYRLAVDLQRMLGGEDYHTKYQQKKELIENNRLLIANNVILSALFEIRALIQRLRQSPAQTIQLCVEHSARHLRRCDQINIILPEEFIAECDQRCSALEDARAIYRARLE